MTGFNTFLYQPLCVRNNSIQLHFLQTEYPNVRTVVTGPTTVSMLQAILSGQCLGGLEDELILRCTLGSGDAAGAFCGLDYVGAPSASAYPFGLPVSSAVSDAQLGALSSAINMALYSGAYGQAESSYLSPARDVCDFVTAQQAAAEASGSKALSAADLSGVFILYAVAVALVVLGRFGHHRYKWRNGAAHPQGGVEEGKPSAVTAAAAEPAACAVGFSTSQRAILSS